MLVDYKQLSKEALYGLCKDYVIANISEVEEIPELDRWIDGVLGKVKSGEVVIEYSEVDESVTLKDKDKVQYDE